jgi:hypothetical protein
VTSTAADYRYAALERAGDAVALKTIERYPLAMYSAGVAVECMLRAFRHPDRDHLPHHDVTLHFRGCDMDRLGEPACKQLRGPIQTVHNLWLNNFRYAAEQQVRRYLKQIKYFSRVNKNADPLKAACIELLDAALEIVRIGDGRWKNS